VPKHVFGKFLNFGSVDVGTRGKHTRNMNFGNLTPFWHDCSKSLLLA
jgi:hypothetical protein